MEIPSKSYGNPEIPDKMIWKSYGNPEFPGNDKMTWKSYRNPMEIRKSAGNGGCLVSFGWCQGSTDAGYAGSDESGSCFMGQAFSALKNGSIFQDFPIKHGDFDRELLVYQRLVETLKP